MADLIERDALQELQNELIKFFDSLMAYTTESKRQAWIQRALPKDVANRMAQRDPNQRDDITFIIDQTRGQFLADQTPLWLYLLLDVKAAVQELFSREDYARLIEKVQALRPPQPASSSPAAPVPCEPASSSVPPSPPAASPADQPTLLDPRQKLVMEQWHFKYDPFSCLEGADDNDLLHYYSPPSDFNKISGVPMTPGRPYSLEPAFVFGPPHSGKSTLRHAITLRARENTEKRILAVKITDVGWLQRQAKGESPSLELYLQWIVRFSAQALYDEKNFQRLRPCTDWDKQIELRQQLDHYFTKFPVMKVHRSELKQILDVSQPNPTEFDSAQIPDQLGEFCLMVCKLFGYSFIYILIDPDTVPKDMTWSLLAPLVSDQRMLKPPGDHAAVKIFLDESYYTEVSSIDWIKQRSGAILFRPLEWDDESLQKMLSTRLRLASTSGKRFYTSLAELTGGAIPDLDRFIIGFCGQSPYELIRLCNQVFNQQANEKTPLIGWPAVNRAIQDSQTPKPRLAQDIIADKVLLTNETLRILIRNHETNWVEFKEAIFIDTRPAQEKPSDKQPGEGLTPGEAVMRAIAAFANTEGGLLIIGVKDNQQVGDLRRDIASKRNEDFYRQAIRELGVQCLDPSPLGVKIFEILPPMTYSEAPVWVIKVSPASRPIYFKKNNRRRFYKRDDNRVIDLDVPSAMTYMGTRFASGVCPVCGQPRPSPAA